MRAMKRSIADAAHERILEEIEHRYGALVEAAIDFARFDAIEQALVTELEQLIAAGRLPAPTAPGGVQWQAETLINMALGEVPLDPRRNKLEDDDCELCRAFSRTSVAFS